MRQPKQAFLYYCEDCKCEVYSEISAEVHHLLGHILRSNRDIVASARQAQD